MRTLIALLFTVSLQAQTIFSPTLTGFSTNPSTECAVYVNDTVNNITTCIVSMSGTGGVSNKTTTTVNLPLPASYSQKIIIATINNGTVNYGRLITRVNSNTADLTTGSGGVSGWTASGTKSFNFSIQYASIPFTRRVVFDGNSLTTHNASSGVSYRVRDSLINDGIYFTMQNYAISGRSTTVLLSEWGSKVKPYVDSNDVVVLWEITNDIASGKTATQAYNNVVSYCDSVQAKGAKAVLCTGIPRNDNVNYWAKIDSVNQMILADTTIADLVINLNSTTFDARTDADNTTYYNADKVHLTASGEAAIASLMLTRLRNYLNQ